MNVKRQTEITRREFMAAAASASALTMAARGFAAAPNTMPVVDTHVHCFAGAKDPRFPYHYKAPYQPEDPATPEDLLRAMEGAGVDYAVIVHPEPYWDDHRYLEHCLRVGGKKFRGTCLFFSDRLGWADQMSELVKRVPIAALRMHAYAPDRLPPFDKPEFKKLWRTAGELGLMIQIHLEPRHAPGFEPLIREFSHTTVLIDHLGRPFQGLPQEHRVVLRWSRYKNTVMKLSAIPSPTEYPHRDVTPIIRQIVDEYGPDRMMYGGGFSAAATPESYRQGREKLRPYLAGMREADRDKIFGGTAARVFKFNA
jgi:predicted TIM-barrel fold metal-dependent hydrolase